MAVALDLGDARTIHPRRKAGIAQRLAELAFASVYRLQGTIRSPILAGWDPEPEGIRVTFPQGSWLETPVGGTIKGLVAAGPDRKFFPAEGRVYRNTLFVSSPSVKDVVAVRYAWADAPDANLTDERGQPVAPFRTDDWPD